jgi:lipopolysaccharide export system protein LptA
MQKRPKPCVIWVFLGLLVPVIAGAEALSGMTPFPLNKGSLSGEFEAEAWDTSAPVDVQSNQLSVNFQKHEIVFQGDVKVTQADFSLTAREVTAVFGETAEDIRQIVAKGDVTIRKSDKVARGEEAVYDRPGGVVVLRGNPYLEQGKNFIQGEEIRVFLKDDTMDVRGGVTAEFRLKEPPDSGSDGGKMKKPSNAAVQEE